MHKPKIIFMGSPACVQPVLAALHHAFDIIAVYSQPPRPSGRGQKLTDTPIAAMAKELGLPVFTPERLKGDALAELQALAPDFICVAAYGLLLPSAVLELAPCLNIHPSDLPRWRGAAPVHHTILAGDTRTAVFVMAMEKTMDTGAVYAREYVDVDSNETAQELLNRLFIIAAPMLVDVIQNWPVEPTPQTGESTHATKFGPEDRPLDWALPALTLHNKIRAFNPMPGATCTHNGETLKVLQSQLTDETTNAPAGTILLADKTGIEVASGDGRTLRLLKLQRPNKQAQDVAEFLNGYTIEAGDTLA